MQREMLRRPRLKSFPSVVAIRGREPDIEIHDQPRHRRTEGHQRERPTDAAVGT